MTTNHDTSSKATTPLDPEAIADYASKVDGVDYTVIVSDEGFPLAFAGLDKGKAEAAAALAVDLILASTETIKDVIGGEGREVIVDIGDGTVIDVAKARNLIILLRGQRKPTEDLALRITDTLSGKQTTCPHCGANLSLEVYKCEKCGKRFPFTSPTCPHCGADARIKKCPSCGNYVSWRGKPVKVGRDPEATRLAIVEAVLGGAAVAAFAALVSDNPIIVVGAGVLGAVAAGYITLKAAPKKLMEQD